MKNKTTLILGAILTFLIILIGGILAYFYLLTPSVTMVDLSNKTIDEVNLFIQENKLNEENYEISYEYSETVEKDKVISQSIEVGKKISEKDILKIVVSNGKDPNLEVSIPDFTNKTESEIKEWFDTNLFTDVSFEYVISDKIEKDKFVSLNVDNNLQKRSALIVVSISAGKDAIGIEIDMPDFKDYTKANMQAWAKSNNITLSIKYESSSKVAEGKLISQSVAAGNKIKTGDKISVTLSSGSGVSVLDFSNKTKAEAEKWVKENKLKATYVQMYDGKVKNDLIISNTPNKGSIKPGGSIQFNISIGLVPIENYTNKTETDFKNYIAKLNASYNKSANIKINVVQEENSKTAGTILSQTINNQVVNSSVNVAPGTTVTIKVSKIPSKKINVVNKANVHIKDFTKYLTDIGLKLGNKTERYSDSVADSLIISNDTGSFTAGTGINYVISIGKFDVNTGILAGKPYSQAQNVINEGNAKGAGWSISKTDVYHDSVAKGNIISCGINGKTLSCNVSLGSQPKVADYVNKPKPCNDSCVINGITYKISSYENSDTIANGYVISQDIASGTVVSPNTTVNLKVSKGKKEPEKVVVDNYVGQTCGKQCTSNNKNYVLTFNEEHNEKPAGTIISQSIAGGTSVNVGTTVNLVVSLGPKPTTKCPTSNIVNPGYNTNDYTQTVNEIRSVYSNFNVVIVDITGETDNPNNLNGTIRNISPFAPELDCGSTITFEVYKPSN